MALRLVIHHDKGHTQVLLRRPADAIHPFGVSRPFTSPLTPADLDDLRFYLEDYALLPVGEFLTRGERVENEKLARWGEALYSAVFADDEKRGEAYATARGAINRGEPVEVTISSNNLRFLGLPWELLKAPEDDAPLSTRVERFDRSLSDQAEQREFADTSNGFRVLMIIARPKGLKDVPFQAVARPLFEHLERHDGPVKIEVLRPPTFEEFRKRLTAAKEAGRPYHAVHFDGHGSFAGGQGYLVFEPEREDIPELISAKQFAAAVKIGEVPLVILNACRSGKIDTAEKVIGPEASIATRLLQEGVASVVAMSHNVYVVAAAAFVAAFYEALFQGKCVGEAVNLGRKALRQEKNSLRPSLKGEMPLQDWMVPVHYARSTLRLPVAPRPKTTSPMEVAGQVLASKAAATPEVGIDPLAAMDKFFGRDDEFFVLERAIRTCSRVALVHGVGGVGKTEVAKAFARWLVASGGLDDPRQVFMHEFLPGRATFGLEAVFGEIIAQLGETDLYLKLPDTRARAEYVLDMLRKSRCLLIWDNFESAVSMPEPGQATPPLDEAKRAELLNFMREMRNTKSALIITSRSDEVWLGGPDALVRCKVMGFKERDALAYADHVLEPHAAATEWRAEDPEGFKRLMDYLQGHPLSLKLVLPHLACETPNALLAVLMGLRDLPESEHGGTRRAELALLTASIEYSFRHLPQEDQQRLMILSLFDKVVSTGILGLLDEVKDAPPDCFSDLDIEGWGALLTRLASLGLVTSFGGGLYALHPALPPFLAARWRVQAGGAFAPEREQTLVSLIDAAATFADRLQTCINSRLAQVALYQIRALRSSLGAFLSVALDHRRFSNAQHIIQALNEYWNMAGMTAAAREWTDRVLAATEAPLGGMPEIETPAHNLWLFVKNSEANRNLFASYAGILVTALEKGGGVSWR